MHLRRACLPVLLAMLWALPVAAQTAAGIPDVDLARSTAVLWIEASEQHDAGRCTHAVPGYEEILRRSPTYPAARERLVECYEQLGLEQDAANIAAGGQPLGPPTPVRSGSRSQPPTGGAPLAIPPASPEPEGSLGPPPGADGRYHSRVPGATASAPASAPPPPVPPTPRPAARPPAPSGTEVPIPAPGPDGRPHPRVPGARERLGGAGQPPAVDDGRPHSDVPGSRVRYGGSASAEGGSGSVPALQSASGMPEQPVAPARAASIPEPSAPPDPHDAVPAPSRRVTAERRRNPRAFDRLSLGVQLGGSAGVGGFWFELRPHWVVALGAGLGGAVLDPFAGQGFVVPSIEVAVTPVPWRLTPTVGIGVAALAGPAAWLVDGLYGSVVHAPGLRVLPYAQLGARYDAARLPLFVQVGVGLVPTGRGDNPILPTGALRLGLRLGRIKR